MTTKAKQQYTARNLFEKYGELTFGEVLKSFRLAEGVSQKDFAAKLQVSPANLCDLEKGRKLPSPKRAAYIARRLGLPETLLIQIALQDELRSFDIDYKVSVAA